MAHALAKETERRDYAFMATRTRPGIDDETMRLGRAIEALRRRLKLTQEQAGAAAEPQMTSQYWGMHETGRVPGIFKPAVQRKIIAALNAASGIEPPLTLDDLAGAIDESVATERLTRMARELQPVASPAGDRGPGPETLEAIFPTRDGRVVVRYPARLTAGGANDLETYLTAFLATLRA